MMTASIPLRLGRLMGDGWKRLGPTNERGDTRSDNTGSVRCIGFNMGKLEKKLLEVDTFSVAYEPGLNTYNGQTSVQFVLTDIQFD